MHAAALLSNQHSVMEAASIKSAPAPAPTLGQVTLPGNFAAVMYVNNSAIGKCSRTFPLNHARQNLISCAGKPSGREVKTVSLSHVVKDFIPVTPWSFHGCALQQARLALR